MGTFSPVHWLIVLIIVGIFAYPVARILHRAGHSGWWTILAFIPLVNIIALWVFAMSPWPALAKPDAA